MAADMPVAAVPESICISSSASLQGDRCPACQDLAGQLGHTLAAAVSGQLAAASESAPFLPAAWHVRLHQHELRLLLRCGSVRPLLQVCADIPVGSQVVRGISGGQKKRVTTGEMLVGPQRVLFMCALSLCFCFARVLTAQSALR